MREYPYFMDALPEFLHAISLPASSRRVSLRFLKSSAAIEAEVENLISKAAQDNAFVLWPVIDEIAALFVAGNQNPMEEIVRRSTTGTKELTYPLLLSLAYFYRFLKSDFVRELEGVDTGRGESETSALVDSLPLLGEDAWLDFSGVRNDGLKPFERKWKRKAGAELAAIVFRGDNHLEKRLTEALIKFLPVASGAAK